MIRKVIYLFSGEFFLLVALSLRPVPILPEKDCVKVEGVIGKIHEGPSYDIVFRLIQDDTFYYINRGLERGLHLPDLQAQLVGKKVTISYPWHWTPLDPYMRTVHISKVSREGKVFFDKTPS